MNFQVISLMPEMILSGLKEGVVGQAITKKMISVECLNPRKFALDQHHSVDDRPFGGGDGMIMLNDPLDESIRYFRELAEPEELIYLSARGELLNDGLAKNLAQRKSICLICGRYGGVDQRVLSANRVREISIGDYILSGGEFAALVLIDAVSRYIPGVLGNEKSALTDSFSEGLLEAPSFTRPREWKNLPVPSVLLSGDHKKIKEWREQLATLSTLETRPDLFAKQNFTFKQLVAAKTLLENMSDDDRKSCGLNDPSRILRILSEAISKRGIS